MTHPTKRAGQIRAFLEPGSRRRLVFDIAIIAVVACAIWVVSVWLDMFELIYDYSRAHEDWEVDEIVTAFLVMSGAFIAFGARRLVDQRREMALRAAAEKRASALAQFDPLTGLPNRRGFYDSVFLTTAKDGGIDAILLIDLDNFRALNDRLGQSAGDVALWSIAQRLEAIADDGITCARIGGDEFALLAEGLSSVEDAAALAWRILAAIEAPIALGDMEHRLNVSVGVTIINADSALPDEHMRQANVALRQAKTRQGAAFAIYDCSMDTAFKDRAQLEQEMRKGLTAGEFVPFYQPIVDLRSERIVKFEALARWQHPTRGELSPFQFISLAEDRGLIDTLTDNIIRQACADALNWPADVTLTVNLSPLLVERDGYPAQLAALLKSTGLPLHRLELEITERALDADLESVRAFLHPLRALGVQLALDDFGTGYSSLSRLQGLRFDVIKIDRSFVRNMLETPETGVIVRAIVELAHGLRMSVTAEGIELPEQRAALIAERCQHGQGFLFSKPVQGNRVAKLLNAHVSPVLGYVARDGSEAPQPIEPERRDAIAVRQAG